MPNCKHYMINIPRFYRYQAFDQIMFGYVQGLRKALPSMSIAEAIRIFLETFHIEEDDYCYDNAYQTYHRMIKAIVEMGGEHKLDINVVL